MKTDIQANYPFRGLLKRTRIFSEIVILGEKHAVLELQHFQLAINRKVIHHWPREDVKSPKTPFFFLCFFFMLQRAFFYFLCTVSGCDGGNRTRNIAVYTWRFSLLSYGRHLLSYGRHLLSYGRHYWATAVTYWATAVTYWATAVTYWATAKTPYR